MTEQTVLSIIIGGIAGSVIGFLVLVGSIILTLLAIRIGRKLRK